MKQDETVMIRALPFLLLTLLATVAGADEAGLFRSLPDGEQRELSDYHEPDKWLIVMIWASDCHVCNREASQYSDFHMFHADTDAKVVGISLDGWQGREAALDFIRRHQVSFDNVVVEPASFLPYYERTSGSRWVGTPSFLVYDPKGILRAKQVGAVPVYLIEQFIAGG